MNASAQRLHTFPHIRKSHASGCTLKVILFFPHLLRCFFLLFHIRTIVLDGHLIQCRMFPENNLNPVTVAVFDNI